jgi:trimethylamine---corrinoid protein Co-methyltransferase
MTDLEAQPTGRRARGGADARRAMRGSTEIKQAGFIRRKMKLYEPFSDDQLELIGRNGH